MNHKINLAVVVAASPSLSLDTGKLGWICVNVHLGCILRSGV